MSENVELEENKYLDLSTISRKEIPNPYGYSNLEIAERNEMLENMLRSHPTIPFKWLEYVYDLVKNKPEEDIKKIINEGLWEKPIKERLNQGVSKSIEVINPGHPEYNDLVKGKKE